MHLTLRSNNQLLNIFSAIFRDLHKLKVARYQISIGILMLIFALLLLSANAHAQQPTKTSNKAVTKKHSAKLNGKNAKTHSKTFGKKDVANAINTLIPQNLQDSLIAFSNQKLRATITQCPDSTRWPRNIEAGKTRWKLEGSSDWTSGFFPGQLWLQYRLSKDPYYFQMARRYQHALAPMKDVHWTHDLGFMLYCPFGQDYALTQSAFSKNTLEDAAISLSTLYMPSVGTMMSWPWKQKVGWEHPTIIDNMMNLELLFWAAKTTGNKAYFRMAEKHALTTAKFHVRPNFTTFHVVNYDTLTGYPRWRRTNQGYADSSTWARGQAWAIYGFSMAYRETQDLTLLTTAEGVADKYINMVEDQVEDYVPYYDFDAPNRPNEPRDASAAAIATSGLMQLSVLSTNKAKQKKYLDFALKTMLSLSSDAYSTRNMPAIPALLLHSTGSKPHNSEIDVSINYADYYYLESLLWVKNHR